MALSSLLKGLHQLPVIPQPTATPPPMPSPGGGGRTLTSLLGAGTSCAFFPWGLTKDYLIISTVKYYASNRAILQFIESEMFWRGEVDTLENCTFAISL